MKNRLQTTYLNPGIVSVESSLCATIHWYSSRALSICFILHIPVWIVENTLMSNRCKNCWGDGRGGNGQFIFEPHILCYRSWGGHGKRPRANLKCTWGGGEREDAPPFWIELNCIAGVLRHWKRRGPAIFHYTHSHLNCRKHFDKQSM